MVVRHPEGYVSIRNLRHSAEVVAAEFATAAQAAGGSTPDPDALAKVRLLGIEHALTAAHEAFFAGRYQEAIEGYQNAQGLIYQLLDPEFPHSLATRPDVKFPLDGSLFSTMLRGSLEFVEAVEPRSLELDFGPSDEAPDSQLAALREFSEAGITIADGPLRSARHDSQLAAAYAQRGQWQRAEVFYRRAKRRLDPATGTEVPEARAAIDASLAAVLIQVGKPADALPLLESARAVFTARNDLVGQAQVAINTAAAQAARGQHDQAAERLKVAAQLINQASGLPPAASGGGGGGGGGPVLGGGGGGPILGGGGGVFEPLPSGPLAAGALSGLTFLGRPDDFVVRRPGTVSLSRSFTGAAATLGLGSTKPAALGEAVKAQGLVVAYRQPGKGGGWIPQPVQTRVEAAEKLVNKKLLVRAGALSAEARWRAGDQIPDAPLLNDLYEARVNAASLDQVTWTWHLPTDLAAQLPHLYFYVIPVALGDSYHALGEFEMAETHYLDAANYQFLNSRLEAPALWQKIAANVLTWGDSHYREERPNDALAIYRKVLEPPGGPNLVDANAPLYRRPKLRPVGNQVRDLLANLGNAPGAVSPSLAAVVLEIRTRLLQIGARLDFVGIPTDLLPISSFDFLQNVARYFAQQAVQAEREYVNFQDRAENEALTQQQLQQTVTQADAERQLAREQREAAEAERRVYQAGRDLAGVRRANAQQNRTSYANMTQERIWIDAAIGWYTGPDYTISDSGGKKAYEEIFDLTYRRGQMTRDYELGAMDRQIVELQVAENMAGQQLQAAAARVDVAAQAEVVSALRAQAARDNVEAFSSQVFTPDVWHQMAEFMRSIAASYLRMAIRTARLAQLAYNFEYDLDRHFVRVDYSTNTVKGLLGANALLLDIDNFTYDLVTSVRRKQMPAKITISLAERYPFGFETEFRRTGRIEFETRVEDFDLAFPGTFGQRIENVEVEVEGILPSSGVRGTLTNAGISHYRTEDVNEIKVRVQPRETMVLSEYRIRNDAVVFPVDPRQLKIFEGAGASSTWTLELPKASNDVEYGQITDVRITFWLQTRYSEDLAEAVKAQLATLAGTTRRARTIPARFAFPDAFFAFQDTGRLGFSLTEVDFPFNEVDPKVARLALLVLTEPGTNPSTWVIRLGVPGKPGTVPASPNGQGEIVVRPGHPWAPLFGGPALGDYLIEMRAGENAGLVDDGRLQLQPIRDLVLLVEYTFTPAT